MRLPRRPLTVLAIACLATLLAATGAQAAPIGYVALGDSYSSGTGTRGYLADGTNCQRSAHAYPSLIAAERGYSLSLRACSGARVADVAGAQLSALSTSTAYVTISVGGNDAGFVGVLTECAKPAWMSDCFGRVETADALIRDSLPNQFGTLYAQIKARAPQARVTVVGYPRMFNGTDCNAFTWFSPQEQQRLNGTADLLNSTMAARARAAGFTFADPAPRFTGHAVCDRPEWLNGLTLPLSESYHPNRAGHASGYLHTVGPYLGGAAGARKGRGLSVSAQTEARAAASAEALTADARRYAARDRSIVPEVVQPVDLQSPQARAAAERAGVDVDDPVSVDRADRQAARAQALAHGMAG